MYGPQVQGLFFLLFTLIGCGGIAFQKSKIIIVSVMYNYSRLCLGQQSQDLENLRRIQELLSEKHKLMQKMVSVLQSILCMISKYPFVQLVTMRSTGLALLYCLKPFLRLRISIQFVGSTH